MPGDVLPLKYEILANLRTVFIPFTLVSFIRQKSIQIHNY